MAQANNTLRRARLERLGVSQDARQLAYEAQVMRAKLSSTLAKWISCELRAAKPSDTRFDSWASGSSLSDLLDERVVRELYEDLGLMQHKQLFIDDLVSWLRSGGFSSKELRIEIWKKGENEIDIRFRCDSPVLDGPLTL